MQMFFQFPANSVTYHIYASSSGQIYVHNQWRMKHQYNPFSGMDVGGHMAMGNNAFTHSLSLDVGVNN